MPLKPGRSMIFIWLIPDKMRILYFSDVHIEIRMEGSRTPWTDIYPLDLGVFQHPTGALSQFW